MKANYLNMLNDKSDTPVVVDPSAVEMTMASPAEMQQPPPTPELRSSPNEFLTSYSREDNFLNTPVVADDDILAGAFDDVDEASGVLFPPINYTSFI